MMALGGFQKELVLRNTETGQILGLIPWVGTIRELQFSPNGQSLLITTENDDILRVYDLKQNRISQKIPVEGSGFVHESLQHLVQFGLKKPEAGENADE